jgi:hypothetical protein
VAESAVEGLLIENAGAAFAKMFKTVGGVVVDGKSSAARPGKNGRERHADRALAFAAMVAVLQEARELAKSAGLFPPAKIFEMMNAVIAAGEKEPAFGIEDCGGAKRTPLVVCLPCDSPSSITGRIGLFDGRGRVGICAF